MKNSMIVLLCLTSVLLSGCCDLWCNGDGLKGSGVSTTEDRDVAPFTALDVSGAYNVTITCGEEQKFVLTGDDNIVPLVITKVRGSKLHVYTDEKISPTTPLNIVLTCGSLNEITGSGLMNLDLFKVDNKNLKIELNGAGSIDAKGRTGRFDVTISGSGTIAATGLEAENVSVTINGAGQVGVFASRSLEAEINGTGSIEYSGEPASVQQQISGMGSLIKK